MTLLPELEHALTEAARTRRRRRPATVALLATAALVFAGVVAAAFPREGEQAAAPVPAPVQIGGTPAPAEVQKALAVFRRPRRPSDVLPRRLRTQLDVGTADPNTSRRVRLAPDRPAYLMAAKGRERDVCMLTPGTLQCPPVGVIITKGVAAGIKTSDTGDTLIIDAIVADGIASVAGKFAGRRATGTVHDNVVTLSISGLTPGLNGGRPNPKRRLLVLSWQAPDGTTKTDRWMLPFP